MIRVYIAAGVALVLLVAGAAGGWKVATWRAGPALAEQKLVAEQLQRQLVAAVASRTNAEIALAACQRGVEGVVAAANKAAAQAADRERQDSETVAALRHRLAESEARPLPADCQAAVLEIARRIAAAETDHTGSPPPPQHTGNAP